MNFLYPITLTKAKEKQELYFKSQGIFSQHNEEISWKRIVF